MERQLHSPRFSGQRTEQVKTGQLNPDRPLVGPSVDTFVGCFVGSARGAEDREISPRGCSRGGSRGRTCGATCGPTRGATRGFRVGAFLLTIEAFLLTMGMCV